MKKEENKVYAYLHTNKLLVCWNGYFFVTSQNLLETWHQYIRGSTYERKLQSGKISVDSEFPITEELRKRFDAIVKSLMKERPKRVDDTHEARKLQENILDNKKNKLAEKSFVNLYLHWDKEVIGEIKLDIVPGARHHINIHIPNEFIYDLMDMMKERFAKVVVDELHVYEKRTMPSIPLWKKLWRKLFS